jgi:hypothetical protein
MAGIEVAIEYKQNDITVAETSRRACRERWETVREMEHHGGSI